MHSGCAAARLEREQRACCGIVRSDGQWAIGGSSSMSAMGGVLVLMGHLLLEEYGECAPAPIHIHRKTQWPHALRERPSSLFAAAPAPVFVL